jgi:oligopeptide transport system substrate-binding protein
MQNPRTLDPGLAEDDVSAFFVSQIFEGLVRIGRDNNVLPAAAERWEMNEDGTRYLFHLKSGALWNDDSYLTAADFVFAWRRNLRLEQETGAVNLLYAIKNAQAYRERNLDDPDSVGVHARNDFILEVALEEPTPYLPYIIAHPMFFPLPMWTIERHAHKWTLPENITTNGPYEIFDYMPGKRMTLGKNPLYQGEFIGNVERAEISTHESIWPALEAYKVGDLDVVCLFNADPGTIFQAINAHRNEVVTIPHPTTFYLSFRSDIPPFNDVRLRRAFVHAVDRQELAREASRGLYTPAAGGFVPPGMVGHSPDIGLEFEPDLARSLLAEAGYPGGSDFPIITWLYPAASQDERIVPYLRDSWRKHLGIDLDSETMEWPQYYHRFTHDPAHLTIMGWSADYPDPDNMLRVTFHSKEGMNTPRWSNPRFDALVENAKRVADQDQRMQLYRQADHILVNEQAVIMPIGYSQGWMLVKPWVRLPNVLSCQMPFNRFFVERGLPR